LLAHFPLFCVIGDFFSFVVYREPVTGPRSPRIAYRQSLRLTGMWHAYLVRARCLLGAHMGVNNQNCVDVQALSNLAIGFPLLLEL